jgi:hypothetical protein
VAELERAAGGWWIWIPVFWGLPFLPGGGVNASGRSALTRRPELRCKNIQPSHQGSNFAPLLARACTPLLHALSYVNHVRPYHAS